MTRKTLLTRDPLCLEHRPAGGHPESPERLLAIYNDLDSRNIPGVYMTSPPKISRQKLELIHSPFHIDAVEATAGTASPVWLDPDTCASAKSHEAALLAAGGICLGVDEVIAGHYDNSFAMVRPPGHHAEPDKIMGFCLFNNIAIAAAHAISEHGLKRILILDPDVHHGNGTQQAFWRSPEVLYVSTHRYPFYPGTGWFDEKGMGKGAGYTLNIPLPYGSGDADVLHIYKEVVEPMVNSYKPELIMISTGFDTHIMDPLGGFQMTEKGYSELYGLFLSWAKKHCDGKLVLSLEGGYDPSAMARSTRTVLEVIGGIRESAMISGKASELACQAAEKALSIIKI